MSTRLAKGLACALVAVVTLSSAAALRAATAEPGFEDLPGKTTGSSPGVARTLATNTATGVGTSLGVGAGTWAANRVGAEAFHFMSPALVRGLAAVLPGAVMMRLPTVLPGLLPALGGGLLGGAVTALVQKKLNGKVDWGSVAFSTAGGVLGATIGGIPGGIVGSLAGDLAWRGGKALWGLATGSRRTAHPALARS